MLAVIFSHGNGSTSQTNRERSVGIWRVIRTHARLGDIGKHFAVSKGPSTLLGEPE